MLAVGLFVAKKVISDSSDHLSKRIVSTDHNNEPLVMHIKGIMVPVTVYDAFVNSENCIDLLLHTLCLIQTITQLTFRTRLLEMITQIVLDLLDDDYRRIPTNVQKEKYLKLLETFPQYVGLSAVFHVKFRSMTDYPRLIRSLLLKNYTKLAVNTMILYGTPHAIRFKDHILPTLVRLKDYSSIDSYVLHTELTHPDNRDIACAHIHELLLAQLRVLEHDLDHLKPYKNLFDTIRILHSQLLILLDKDIDKVYRTTLDLVSSLKLLVWIACQTQKDIQEVHQTQLEHYNVCVLGLISKNIACLSIEYRHLAKILILHRLCSSQITYKLGCLIAKLFDLSEYSAQFDYQPLARILPAQASLPLYGHKSYIQLVDNEQTLDVLQTLLHQLEQNAHNAAVGVHLEHCPTIESELVNPSVLQISFIEICKPTTGRTPIDAYIKSQRGGVSRISFIIDLLNIDCNFLLTRLFENKTILKIVYDLDAVRSLSNFFD